MDSVTTASGNTTGLIVSIVCDALRGCTLLVDSVVMLYYARSYCENPKILISLVSVLCNIGTNLVLQRRMVAFGLFLGIIAPALRGSTCRMEKWDTYESLLYYLPPICIILIGLGFVIYDYIALRTVILPYYSAIGTTITLLFSVISLTLFATCKKVFNSSKECRSPTDFDPLPRVDYCSPETLRRLPKTYPIRLPLPPQPVELPPIKEKNEPNGNKKGGSKKKRLTRVRRKSSHY